MNYNQFIEKWKNISRGCQTDDEAFRICEFLETTNTLEGCVIEVGVFRGETAKIMYEYMNPNKKMK